MSSVQLIHGDCLQAMASLPSGSVDTIVTSPPYYGLRDYGTATWDGGSSNCDHAVPLGRKGANAVGTKQTTNAGSYGYREWLVCGKCGAVRVDQQIGLEGTPQAYVCRLVEVFEEARRVLRDDGTFWLNLGDSYCSSPPGNTTKGVSAKSGLHGVNGISGKYHDSLDAGHATKRDTSNIPGLKPKDLIGIPWRVAFALQTAGWYLRSEIIWHKPNPMPESVTDRPTKAHEQIFLLAKSERYFYDHEAIKEPTTQPLGEAQLTAQHKRGVLQNLNTSTLGSNQGAEYRNRRTVWTQATRPYRGAHFATFPPDLIRPCIRAGCRPGGTVLDPFFGAGTTGVVCVEEGRACIGIDLNEEYLCLAQKRIADVQAQLVLDVREEPKPIEPTRT